MRTELIVVPHTHWDREWYEPYQTFRMALVELVDDLLDLLEADPGYAHFQLDGQMAVVDDYLEIRPQHRDRLVALATAGRLSMGPWYILPDEFLVSGETLVRDLQLGITRATEFGGAMDVGYLPDMFGHVSQMPQLLALAGFEHTVVWRGVPRAVDRSAFWWEAPDGSRVRAEYLLDGYGNGAHLPDDAKSLLGAIDRYRARYADFARDGEPVLWMNGTDHLRPQRWLGRVVAEANDLDDDLTLRVGSLADYLALAPTDDLPTWRGELRSGARANLLMGVASNRVDVKQAAARAERLLEREAEPLAALFLAPEDWPAPYLDLAWREVIRNSAHDSICACSVDEVGRAVLVRFDEAIGIADGIADRARRALARSMAEPGPVVANPGAEARSGLVELRLPGRDPVPGTQLLGHRGGERIAEGISRADASTLLRGALDNLGHLAGATAAIGDDGVLSLRITAASEDGPTIDTVRQIVDAAVAEDPGGPARIATVSPEAQKVLAWVDGVPGFGWQRWTPTEPDAPVSVTEDPKGVFGQDTVHLGNGLVELDVDPRTGTFALDGVTGLGRLVDDGDTGDTYNYNPPADDTVVDLPERVEVTVVERGPLRARVAITRHYRWPTHAQGERRVGDAAVAVTTVVEVQAGSPVVRIDVELDNPSRDHRLRMWFPLPHPAETSEAECAFATVVRPTVAEGGPTERALATFPSRRFVCAGGLTLLHEGLLEYELVELGDDGAAHGLAITLLRATGLISQGPMPYRALPAGPVTPTPAAQMPGRLHCRLALVADGHDGAAERAYRHADEVFVALRAANAPGGGTRVDRGNDLEVTGAIVSALRREAGRLQLRLFNPTGEATEARLAGQTGWIVDLRGRPVAPFVERVPLGPHQIVTLQLDER